MGTRLGHGVRGAALLYGAFVLPLSIITFGAAAPMAAAAPVVVGSVKCLDCLPNDVNAQEAFRGLQVAIKCRSGADETYETQTLGRLDDTGAFRIPLAANLLRDDGELDGDCFAQLHSAPDTPCAGQAPPKIAPAGPNPNSHESSATPNTYLAVADDAVFSPVACACGKFKKKHFMLRGPPPPPRPEPSYGPPSTPTPAMPEPSYGTPTPMPPRPMPPAEEDPEPSFHKHPKMKSSTRRSRARRSSMRTSLSPRIDQRGAKTLTNR